MKSIYFLSLIILLSSITYNAESQATKLKIVDRYPKSDVYKNSNRANSGTNIDWRDQRSNGNYIPDNNPVTYDEDPTNYPLERPHTYINVQRTEVQSPTHYNSIPPGACAICSDGTFSFSQNRRGTCSRHGGVAKWLR